MKFQYALLVLTSLIPYTLFCTIVSEIFDFRTIEESDELFHIKQNCVQIMGLTRNTLRHFRNRFESIQITNFTFGDLDTLNQPNLFTDQSVLHHITFSKYYEPEPIVLHGDLFHELDNLREVTLSGLNLETIPNNLFRHCPMLSAVNISHNKLTSLDSTMFDSNYYLEFIDLSGNPLLQSDQLLELTFVKDRIILHIAESYIRDFTALIPLLKNEQIFEIHLDTVNILDVKLSDFARFPNRDNMLNIRIYNSDHEFDFADLIERGTDVEIITKDEILYKLRPLRGYLHNTLSIDSSLCSNCKFIKESFTSYLRDGGYFIYLTEPQLLVEFNLADCKAMENHYTIAFTSNCPDVCECKHNPLLEKIWFDCQNKNLTSIPVILKPQQFIKITSISIDLSRNQIETIELSNIERSLLHLISEINLTENQLNIVNFGDTVLLNLHQIQLCHNPMWGTTDNIRMYIGKTWRDISGKRCSVGTALPINSLKYMSERSNDFWINEILENEQCS